MDAETIRGRLDELVARSDATMIVVTAGDGRRDAGCLVGFHSQSSIDPWRYTVYLSVENLTYRVARRATHLGVHFLDRDQLGLARVFGERTGDDEPDKLASVDRVRASDGITPLLAGVDGWMLGRIVVRHHADGDHGVFVLEPVDVCQATSAAPPLRYHDVTDLSAGHPA